MCLEKGLTGKVIDLFQSTILTDEQIDWDAIEQKYNHVYLSEHAIPEWIFSQIQSKL